MFASDSYDYSQQRIETKVVENDGIKQEIHI